LPQQTTSYKLPQLSLLSTIWFAQLNLAYNENLIIATKLYLLIKASNLASLNFVSQSHSAQSSPSLSIDPRLKAAVY